MKKILFYSLFLIFCSELSAQLKFNDVIAYEVVYDLKYQINKEDTLNIQSENMLLRVGHNYSEFLSYNSLKTQEAKKEVIRTGKLEMRKAPKSKLKYRIIKDNKNQQVLFFNSFGVIKLYYSNPLNDFDWKLQNEEKQIKGYKCKKATTKFGGRNYTAWYTTDVPIIDGPYKFYGLPGLILEIYDSKQYYHFKLSSLTKVNKNYATKFNKYINVTEKQFDEHLKKVKSKPSLMAKTDIISFSKEMLDKIDRNGRKKFKYENNPIELKEKDE